MRTLLSHLLLAFSLSARVLSTPSPEVPQPANVEEDVLGIQKQTPNTVPTVPVKVADDAAEEDEEVKPTAFNGITVPPLPELTGETFEDDTDEGYWYVSDICPNICLKYLAQRLGANN